MKPSVRFTCIAVMTAAAGASALSPGVSAAGPGSVRDSHHRIYLRPGGESGAVQSVPNSEAISFDGGLTVEAWVTVDRPRPETMQPVAAKWSPAPALEGFAAYDAGNTDGLASMGYFGAVFDGRHVYFSPEHYDNREAHGIVLRLDTQGDFHAPSSYAAYDAGNTGGLETKGFYGAVFDGRWVYFVARKTLNGNHSRMLRYDTFRNFKDPGSWESHDAGEDHTHQGAAFDGRYIYFAPGYWGDPRKEDKNSGRVIRFDTRRGFGDGAAWRVYDASATGGLETVCFDGAAFDGRYVYFVPLLKGAVLRYDTSKDFGDPGGWAAFDARKRNIGMCVGAVFDGRMLYFVPYMSGVVVRSDTAGDFADDRSWDSVDAGNVGGLNTGGFDGGFFDGRFINFVPFVSPGKGSERYEFHSNILRYDTMKRFDDVSAWTSRAAPMADGLETIGYNGGAYDGRFFYLAPWRNGNGGKVGIHGRILRVDTVGERGSFMLMASGYGHNGGLCAAAPGPVFIVNTDRGPVSVSSPEFLQPGDNHLAGVYDGKTLKLFVNGSLAAERTGSGKILRNTIPVTIGGMHEASARFGGTVGEIRISDIARSDAEIKKAAEEKR